jgi:hypothetical protein
VARPDLTPCIVCEKAVMYLWNKEESPDSINLDGATHVTILAWYGSVFDMNEYDAILCDDCLDAAVQSRRVRFVQKHQPFG